MLESRTKVLDAIMKPEAERVCERGSERREWEREREGGVMKGHVHNEGERGNMEEGREGGDVGRVSASRGKVREGEGG